MQRAFLALISTLLLAVVVMPTAAQGGSIANIIDNRSDLSTLAIFLDAADPSVREMLSGSGPFTMFAPDNIAFQNLASLLDIPIQDLLLNPEIVTQILQYHIISRSLDANGVAQLNGQVVPTQLVGAFIGIRLDDNGQVAINNVVEIEQANIRASNGMVHVVNDVLLNRLIAAAIDNVNLQNAITPNPFLGTETPTPTFEPTPLPENIAAGNLRIAHLVPDAGAVDVYVNDTVVFAAVSFADISNFVSLQPGTYTVALAPADTSIEDAILGPLGVTIADGDFITVAATGSTENESVDVALLDEDYSLLPDDRSRLTIYHAVEAESAVDMTEAGEILLENIAYRNLQSVDIEAGIRSRFITVSGEEDTVILNLARSNFRAGAYYFVVIAGSTDAMTTFIEPVYADEATELRAGQALLDIGTTASNIEDGENDLNILATLEESGDFGMLIAALEVADDVAINRLGAAIQEPVTLLAPTDRAIENLLATLDISETSFLRNTDLVTDILLYHIIEGEISAADFRAAAGTSIITMLPENQAFFVTVTTNGTILLNGFVQFEQVDILASNGIIHIIEEVLLPASVVREFGL